MASEQADDSTSSANMFSGTDSIPAKIVTQFHQALKSGDKELARSLLADNVLIFEGGGVERSAEEYAHHHMLADMKYLAAVNSTMLEHHVQITGNSAISISRSKTSGTYKGKDVDYEGMETMVLAKHANGWKIVHIHWSN
ncbi:YybH family protein [Thalassotalea sp. ND16A]|uniref:YybH family protein n=1 Tax=Thalassotalea sp. ND16A TaxID=1535422 RepID=UPI001F3EA640|nr:nuclear transport factor 2 family protein [Thalassotalea sp. ND16A]